VVRHEAGALPVLDASQLPRLRQLGSYSTAGYVNNVRAKDDVAYLAFGAAGLQLLDIKHPRKLEPLGRYETLEAVSELDLGWPYVYLAQTLGIDVLDVSNPTNILKVQSSERQPLTALQATACCRFDG